jgi:hypothetical protein
MAWFINFGSPQYKYKWGVNGESGHRKRGLSASNEEILKPFGNKRSNGNPTLLFTIAMFGYVYQSVLEEIENIG